MLDKRAQILLKTLVERYIAEGQPVGSRTLSRHSGLDLSPATIRNVMSDLEELGLIASPHTSAGRVPTPLGYRFFVDSLLVVKQLDSGELHQLEDQLHPDNPQRVIKAASQLLSQLTNFAGVVMTPRRRALSFRQIEFLRLSEKRVLLIVVTPDGDVQNRILFTERDYTPFGAGLGGELHQPELFRPQLRGHPPARARGAARDPPGHDVADERRAGGERPGGDRGQRAVRDLGRAQPARGAATCRRT